MVVWTQRYNFIVGITYVLLLTVVLCVNLRANETVKHACDERNSMGESLSGDAYCALDGMEPSLQNKLQDIGQVPLQIKESIWVQQKMLVLRKEYKANLQFLDEVEGAYKTPTMSRTIDQIDTLLAYEKDVKELTEVVYREQILQNQKFHCSPASQNAIVSGSSNIGASQFSSVAAKHCESPASVNRDFELAELSSKKLTLLMTSPILASTAVEDYVKNEVNQFFNAKNKNPRLSWKDFSDQSLNRQTQSINAAVSKGIVESKKALKELDDRWKKLGASLSSQASSYAEKVKSGDKDKRVRGGDGTESVRKLNSSLSQNDDLIEALLEGLDGDIEANDPLLGSAYCSIRQKNKQSRQTKKNNQLYQDTALMVVPFFLGIGGIPLRLAAGGARAASWGLKGGRVAKLTAAVGTQGGLLAKDAADIEMLARQCRQLNASLLRPTSKDSTQEFSDRLESYKTCQSQVSDQIAVATAGLIAPFAVVGGKKALAGLSKGAKALLQKAKRQKVAKELLPTLKGHNVPYDQQQLIIDDLEKIKAASGGRFSKAELDAFVRERVKPACAI